MIKRIVLINFLLSISLILSFQVEQSTTNSEMIFIDSGSNSIIHNSTLFKKYFTSLSISQNSVIELFIENSNADGSMEVGFMNLLDTSIGRQSYKLKNNIAPTGSKLIFNCNASNCNLTIQSINKIYTNLIFPIPINASATYLYVNMVNFRDKVVLTKYLDSTVTNASDNLDIFFSKTHSKQIVHAGSTSKLYYVNHLFYNIFPITFEIDIKASLNNEIYFGFLGMKNIDAIFSSYKQVAPTGTKLKFNCSSNLLCLLDIYQGVTLTNSVQYQLTTPSSITFFANMTNTNDSVEITASNLLTPLPPAQPKLIWNQSNSISALTSSTTVGSTFFSTSYIGKSCSFTITGINLLNDNTIIGMRNIANPRNIKSSLLYNSFLSTGQSLNFNCTDAICLVTGRISTTFNLTNSDGTALNILIWNLNPGQEIQILNYVESVPAAVSVNYTNPYDPIALLSIGEIEQYRDEMLNQHNYLRSLHNTPPLVRDSYIDLTAQAYANILAMTCSNSLVHSLPTQRVYSDSTVNGENLAFSTSQRLSGAQFSTLYYDEINSYDYNNPGFSSGTGHFTQLIWKSSTKIGTGVQRCYNTVNKVEYLYVVNQYNSAGNVSGQYVANVLPLV